MKEFIEKLIGRLEESQERYEDVAFMEMGNSGHTFDYEFAEGKKEAMGEAIEIVNQIAEEYNNGWIACSERLPEDFMGFEYLTVKRNHTGVNISYFCVANHKWYESRNSKREVDVVMWHDIPLPQPYKENENGKI